MNMDQLRELIDAAPFVPFSLIMPNGEKLRVPHPDFIWLVPRTRTAVVAKKNGVVRMVNLAMVTSIETRASAA